VKPAQWAIGLHCIAFTIYGEQFFKNLEEVKKVILAERRVVDSI
jgi:hypothetical protein